jgi:hypothetical protein
MSFPDSRVAQTTWRGWAIPLEHDEPLVSVICKYNHDKNRLLNELIGRDDFGFCRDKDGGSSE